MVLKDPFLPPKAFFFVKVLVLSDLFPRVIENEGSIGVSICTWVSLALFI